jgi:uncharacterized delta-60 repeat protein
MKRKSPHRSAFFNLRILIALVLFLTGIFAVLFATAGPWEAARQADAQVRNPNGSPFASSNTVQQAWVAQYNGPGNFTDIATAIAVDGSGNVYVTGESIGSGTDYDYVTIKYNAAGQEQWVARYNGPGNSVDIANAIAVDSLGNVYVTGGSDGAGLDYATIKYNSAGQEQWVARYNGPVNGDDYANTIAVDGSGNVYVTGSSEGGGYPDYVTIKYNSAGQEQWVARYNGPGLDTDEAYAIALDGLGNVYVTGHSVGSGTGLDYATIKYNSAGQQQWVARYNGPVNGDDYAQAIAVDGSSNVYVTGSSNGVGSDLDYVTIKYNSAGQEQWAARYNGPASYTDEALAIALDGSGNVYVTGTSWSNYPDYATVKYNSAGQQQWVARYDGPGSHDDGADAIAIDGSSNVYVTGSSNGVGSDLDYVTIKYNSAGQEQWVARYNGPVNGDDYANAIAVDGSGIVYVTGGSYGAGLDYATIKYVQQPTRPAPTPRSRPTPHATATAHGTPAITPLPRPTPPP